MVWYLVLQGCFRGLPLPLCRLFGGEVKGVGEVGNGCLGQELLCHQGASTDLQGEQSLGLESMG